LRAREAETEMFIETCPHYLTHGVDWEGGDVGKINPPLREREDCEALWAWALRRDASIRLPLIMCIAISRPSLAASGRRLLDAVGLAPLGRSAAFNRFGSCTRLMLSSPPPTITLVSPSMSGAPPWRSPAGPSCRTG
jgi:hypothetical protein